MTTGFSALECVWPLVEAPGSREKRQASAAARRSIAWWGSDIGGETECDGQCQFPGDETFRSLVPLSDVGRKNVNHRRRRKSRADSNRARMTQIEPETTQPLDGGAAVRAYRILWKISLPSTVYAEGPCCCAIDRRTELAAIADDGFRNCLSPSVAARSELTTLYGAAT
jgi:hypothetical protein